MDCLRRYIFSGLFSLLILAGPVLGFGQQIVSIYVSDSSVAKPVTLSDAVVRVVPLSKTSKDRGSTNLTDRRGIFTFTYTEPVVVHISYLGYKPVIDTLSSPQARSYQLKRTTANIDDIVVTGQYNAASAKESIYQIEVYTTKDIREKGATTLLELLEGSLDIGTSHDEVFGSSISLQGISGDGVKVLIDGVPVVGRNSEVLDVSQISLANVERVEVIKGPMSAVYGTDAMGGVMNLITKNNQDEKYNINLKGYYESVGQYNAELNGGLNIGKSQFFASGGRNFFGGYSAVDTSRHKDWAPKEQYFGNLKYVYNTGKFKFGTTLSFLRELLIDRGDLLTNTDYAFDTHYLTLRPMGSVFATIPIRDYSKIEMLVAYTGYVQFIDVYQKNLVTLSQNLQPDQAGDTSVYHDIIARATYTLTALNKKISFQGGVDIDQEYTHQTLIAGLNQSMGDYAVFSSALFKPIIGLDIQPALRFSYNTKFNTPLIPNLNIKYSFARYFSLRASYGLGYRAPSLQEVYLSFHDSNHNLNGNPDLVPEKGNCGSLEFDFQIRWRHDQRFKIANTGFYNKINNKIDFILTDASSTPVTYQYFNINNYVTTGAEHTMEYGWRRLTLGAGIHYIWYQVTLGQAGAAPQHLLGTDATLKLSYMIPKAEIGLRIAYKYTGKTLLYSLIGGNADEQGFLNPYNLVDVSLTKDFWKNRIQLTCGIKNLLNVNNIGTNGAVPFGHTFSDVEDILWGRTYFVSLNLHFSK
jgi:outer membrane receptor for ferrienterochelin and colicins